MYLKTKKEETNEVNNKKGVKLLTVVPIVVVMLSAMGLTSVMNGYELAEQTNELTTISNISTVTENTTEITTIEATTETTTEIQIIEEPIIEPETEVILPAVLSYNTAVKSNLTEDQYNQILSGTPLAGYGYAFKDIEDSYGVNGIFALSVALNETSYGAAGVGRSRNNVFSNTQASGGYIYFDNKIDSIYYFGAYIPRVQWGNGRYYVGDIAPSYCDYVWGDKVESSMSDIYERIN